MTEFAAAAFWVSACLISVPLFWYPLSLYVFSWFRPRETSGDACPNVTLVISAYNEQDVIAEKIENAFSLDYPGDKLDIMVISDASDDRTDEIVNSFIDNKAYDGDRLRLCRQESRQGKSAGLTRFCPGANGEILVFTDANSIFQPDAIEKLVRHFSDTRIGYVVGCQRYQDTKGAPSAESEKAYWDFELTQKRLESRVSSVVGADGAIYALRKSLFQPLAPEDINDFVLPLRLVADGHRGRFEPEAVCYESAAPDFQGEFRRKYRIVNRSMHAVVKVPQSLNPLRVGIFAWQLFAHKVLRWLGPIFLITMLITSIYLTAQGSRLYCVLSAVQIVAYLIAAAYLVVPLRRMRVVYLAYYFVLVNVASLYGLALLVSGRTIGVWKPQR